MHSHFIPKQVKPGFTNYQAHPSNLGLKVKLKGGETKIKKSKHRKMISKNPDFQCVATI